ncbi:hypothetical protein N7497_003867 [Penicillium chrysogenum]|jgi:hypothetical protein|nr:hypothetical protein N7497_003867 [Penicillium chrysogenum]
MKIESLLNPSADKGNDTIAPKKHWCGQHLRVQYTSQRTISTVPAKARTNGASRNKLHLQFHNHHQRVLDRPSELASFAQKLWQRHRCHSNTLRTASADRRRSPRPKYEKEEMYFIWYHRVDLCQRWKEVHESFNRQFPNRQRVSSQGMQSKFYRFIKQKNCPTPREQLRMRDCAPFDSRSYSSRLGVV